MGKKTRTAACHGGGGGGGDDPNPFLLHLPEEVLIQILVRLSIQSLLRFKCVCKSWRALIQTSFFIDLHTNTTTFNSSSKFGTFILRTHNIIFEGDGILMLSEYEGGGGSAKSPHEYGDWYRCIDGSWHKFTTDDDDDDDQLLLKDDDDQLLLKVDNLELPSCYNNKLTYNKHIAGSCNGLICLHDTKRRDVTLWNPATRQFRILPKSISTIQEEEKGMIKIFSDFVAFGFDVKTKDYKVLLIRILKSKSSRPPNFFCQVQVYSLSTDSWRLLEGGLNSPLVGLPDNQDQGVLYINGSCFFMAYNHESNSTRSTRFIISFDFTKEIFTTIQLPHDDDYRQGLFLRCLGGGEKMALFTTLRKTSSGEIEYPYAYDHDGYEDCDIWVLNELNKESCWTKLHSFQIKNCRDGIPMGISNNGKFAFLETTGTSYMRRIWLYDLVTKEVKLDIPFRVSSSIVYVYKPSLVSVIGGN